MPRLSPPPIPQSELNACAALQKEFQLKPTSFSKNLLGSSLWEKQIQIMNAVRDYPRVTVRSGHSIGKTRIAAEIALWWLVAFYPSKVITTAPTNNQVENVLWKEIKTLYSKCKMPLGGKLLNKELKFNDEWFAIGFATDEVHNFQGFKSPNLLVILDEASGIHRNIWEATDGLLPKRILALGNPLDPIGPFAESFKSELWHKIVVSSLETPNYVNNNTQIPGLATRQFVQERLQEWGEESPLYQSRVLGNFPVESDDTLIPFNWIERAVNKHLSLHRGIVIACDVARHGSDETVICIYDGFNVLDMQSYRNKGNTEVAGIIIDTIQQRRMSRIPIIIDDTGLGGGVTDILKEQGYNVTGLIMQARAKRSDKYRNVRAEMYFELKEKFKTGSISIPDDQKLISQLASVKYTWSSKGEFLLFAMMSKDKMKKQGLDSPDRADVLAMANYYNKSQVRNPDRIRYVPPLARVGTKYV